MPHTSWNGPGRPFIQAPMAGSQDSAMAIAVCRAGGIGSLPTATMDVSTLRAQLMSLAASAQGPYNVNFFAHETPRPDDEAASKWLDTLAPYYAEYDVDPTTVPRGAGRSPFNDDMAALVEEFKPAIVSFHFGLPRPALFERVKRAGCYVMSSATTLEEALWLEERGVDAIIAQGLEAGGHRGHFLDHDLTRQSGLMALLPRIVAAVDRPVVAAGGIADVSAVRAAFALGAAAVQAGTAFLLCPEATTSAVYRAALKGPERSHTALTNVFTGRPARGIVNRAIRELGPLSDVAPAFPLASGLTAPLKALAEARGRDDFSSLWAGQNTEGCEEIGAADMARRLMAGLPAAS